MSSWTMPVGKGRVTAKYKQPGGWAAGFHTGVDFGCPTGTPVNSVGPGTVVVAGDQGAYGNCVVVQMSDGRFTLYAHLSSIDVKAGQGVAGGQRLGLSGATGNVTGPHLHFEARTANHYNGHTDPLAYLASHGVAKAGGAKKSTVKKAAAKKTTARKTTAKKAAPRAATYTVKAGDTLGAIAQSKLGNAGRYPEIAKLNGIPNPDHITVGQKLKLPPK
ncbi:peptidoglycan DD-metalloendopeptidase family protein [Streptomyces sp. YC504]|uniref:Peptidoglycan DD-metalloendopeptidase family protein n=1 Tax=Streptomyces mesophilus TaxID=1775132 RepID=A0A6G4XQF9_9ACTN|nr:peptidoglycan DD-metalloendopeptidase family protein [Streptomyces mesophilus]NGO79668.1 peptidoglycan DD-metalloendopeptidase family protein [Streptomyces mesophilus]